jgi:hypothetical protein
MSPIVRRHPTTVETPSLIALLNMTALVTIMLPMGLQVNIQDVLASAWLARLDHPVADGQETPLS